MILRNGWPVKRRPEAKESSMNIDLDTSTLTLARDGLIALRDAQGTRVTCLTGALWITEDREHGDIVLEAGETVTLQRPGLTLVMALQPAELRLAEQRETTADWFAARLSRWLSTSARPVLN
jgi:glutamine phosphoribosylpyrophosphate amidotransferase